MHPSKILDREKVYLSSAMTAPNTTHAIVNRLLGIERIKVHRVPNTPQDKWKSTCSEHVPQVSQKVEITPAHWGSTSTQQGRVELYSPRACLSSLSGGRDNTSTLRVPSITHSRLEPYSPRACLSGLSGGRENTSTLRPPSSTHGRVELYSPRAYLSGISGGRENTSTPRPPSSTQDRVEVY